MNLTQIIEIKERIAVGELLSPEQRNFVLGCINEAIGISGALARTRGVVGDSADLRVFEIELQRAREGRR